MYEIEFSGGEFTIESMIKEIKKLIEKYEDKSLEEPAYISNTQNLRKIYSSF